MAVRTDQRGSNSESIGRDVVVVIRRFHPSKLHRPGPRAAEEAPKDIPKGPRRILALGYFRGHFNTVDRFIRVRGELF